MSGLQISVPGHGRWVQLPLEGDLDAQATATARTLTATTPALTDQVAAMIAGTARVVVRWVEQAAGEGIPTFLAWSLLPAPGYLQLGPVALLRGVPLAADATDDDVIRTVVDFDAERHGQVDVDQLETASGRAWTVRWRPVVHAPDGTRQVHEQRAVVWPHREREMALQLSFHVMDLLDGAGVAEPLAELAAGVRWSLT